MGGPGEILLAVTVAGLLPADEASDAERYPAHLTLTIATTVAQRRGGGWQGETVVGNWLESQAVTIGKLACCWGAHTSGMDEGPCCM